MMDQNYEMALSEVDEILNYTDEELVKKIPIQLRILISNNKNKEYKPNIDRTRPISEQELLKETKAILSLLFRSYWATEEEKLEFEKQDALEYENLSKSIEVIFPVNRKQEQNVNVQSQNVELTVVDNIPWYRKIYNKIIKLFKHSNK